MVSENIRTSLPLILGRNLFLWGVVKCNKSAVDMFLAINLQRIVEIGTSAIVRLLSDKSLTAAVKVHC